MANVDDFEALLDLSEVAGPVSREVVDAAEADLGVVFPEQYRAFVEHYGAALVPGAEIFGIVEQTDGSQPAWSDVRNLTRQLRAQHQAGADDLAFLPVSEDGAGIYFYLDTRAAPRAEVWAVGPGITRLVSRDFHKFVVRLASGDLMV